MATEISIIVSLLHKSYEGGAWHGPSVKEALAGISQENAFYRLPNTHSIIELVAHMAAWKIYVTKKLCGDHAYKVTDELNFPSPTGWEETVDQLNESQRQLLAAIESFPAEKLQDQVPWTKDSFTPYSIIHGIIHHDLYHAGQIILIKKASVQQSL